MHLTGSNKAQASIGMSIKLALSLILIQHAVRQRSWLVTNDAFLNMHQPFAAYHRVIRSFHTKRKISFPLPDPSILIHLPIPKKKNLGIISPIKLFSHHNYIAIDSSDIMQLISRKVLYLFFFEI